MSDDIELIAEDWKKEPDKWKLTLKADMASTAIGKCTAEPTLDNLKGAYGAVTDYVNFMPIGNQEADRDAWLKELDEIGMILYGDPKDAEVRKVYETHKVMFANQRSGVTIVKVLVGIPNILRDVRDVFIKASNFAQLRGLRTQLPVKKKTGVEKLLSEEGVTLDEPTMQG